ncbi:MAG TPA: glycosyltransferase [Planctomycetota bacterium]|nr:glycosyltransferase [Planctomycetota bacterium]
MDPEETPAASVIIVTRDRREDLAAALDSVAAEKGSFEVIVVDDASRDGTPALLASRPHVGAVRRDTPGGPGVARNDGARRARGRALVFLDSDCRVLPGWLEAMLAPLERADVGAVGGAEALDPLEPLLGRVFHFVLTSPLTTGRIRGGSGGRAARYRPRSYSLAVRRADFERAGGFRPMHHGEDIDFAARIAALGLDLVHAPDARVHHRRRRTWKGFAAQLHAMGRARAALIRRDRVHLEPFYLAPPGALLLAACAGVAAALVPAARVVVAALACAALAYLLAVGMAAARALGAPRALALAPLAFVVQQAAYGTGFLRGLGGAR